MPRLFLNERGIKTMNVADVYRSEHFVRYFIDEEPGLPSADELWSMLDISAEETVEQWNKVLELYPQTAGARLDAQQTGAPLMHNLQHENIDIILMDNWHDSNTNYTVMRDTNGEFAWGCNTHIPFFKPEYQERLYYKDVQPAAEMASNWNKIARFVREQQPYAKIFMICGHYVTSWEKKERFRLLRDFYLRFVELTRDVDINIVPPLHLPPGALKLPDEAHYDLNVYRAMAGYIYLAHVAHWPDFGRTYQLPSDVAAF